MPLENHGESRLESCSFAWSLLLLLKEAISLLQINEARNNGIGDVLKKAMGLRK